MKPSEEIRRRGRNRAVGELDGSGAPADAPGPDDIPTTGRPITAAQLFVQELRTPIGFLRLVSASLLFVLIFLGCFGGVMWMLRKNASQINVSTAGAQILLTKDVGDTETSLVLVHPQGWQDSGIVIHKGDRIRFRAGGNIDIDLSGLATSAMKRHDIENRIEKRMSLDKTSMDTSQRPERHYNTNEREELHLRRAWTGPQGYHEGLTDSAWKARTPLKILPESPYGALLGAFVMDKARPTRESRAFLIGDGIDHVFTADQDGSIWFTVNDVLDDENPEFPDRFYVDNIGTFWVKVTIDHVE